MSHILAHIIKKKLPAWNSRVLRYRDIPDLCHEARCGFIEGPSKHKGEYVIRRGLPLIVLKQDLRHELRDWVPMHELGHHLLHYPVPHKFSRGVYTKADREANFFAAIALMPTVLCRQMTPDEIIAEYGYAPEIVQIRLEITEHFKI